MATRTFWVVMGEQGLSCRPVRHLSNLSAYREAERLCRAHGGTFYVLEAVGQAERQDVRVERYGRTDDVPF